MAAVEAGDRSALERVVRGLDRVAILRPFSADVATVRALVEQAREVQGRDEIAQVATISSQDAVIGGLIASPITLYLAHLAFPSAIGPTAIRAIVIGVIVLFGILGAAVVSLTMLPALTIAALQWNENRKSTAAPAT